MKANIQINNHDYIEFCTYRKNNLKLFKTPMTMLKLALPIFSIFLGFVVFIRDLIVNPFNLAYGIYLYLFLIIILPITLICTLNFINKRAYKKILLSTESNTLIKFTLEITDEYLEITSIDSNFKMPLAAIYTVSKHKDLTLIFLDDINAIIIPDRCLNSSNNINFITNIKNKQICKKKITNSRGEM